MNKTERELTAACVDVNRAMRYWTRDEKQAFLRALIVKLHDAADRVMADLSL